MDVPVGNNTGMFTHPSKLINKKRKKSKGVRSKLDSIIAPAIIKITILMSGLARQCQI